MAIFHLNVSTGSRGGGQSAAAKADYVQREGKYAKGDAEVLHVEHDHMPAFAADNPQAYWEAADAHERANGRLFRQVEFALPVELTDAEKIALANEFAQSITAAESMPYTLAIHRGEYDHQGRKMDTPENPHVHLIISERANDGIERSPEQWFKRANKSAPEKGGAAKTKSLESKDWLYAVREQWAEMANAALERAGHDARIDHRTLEEQGIDRIPQIHKGAADHMSRRGIETERMAQAVQIDADNQSLALMSHQKALQDVEIERLDKAITEVKKTAQTAKEKAAPVTYEQQVEQYKKTLLASSLEVVKDKYKELANQYKEVKQTIEDAQRAWREARNKKNRATEQHNAAFDRLAEIGQGMMAKVLHRKEIAECEAAKVRHLAERAEYEKEEVRQEKRQQEAEQFKAEVKDVLDITAEMLPQVGDKERHKHLTDRFRSPEVIERWGRWKEHLEGQHHYKRASVLEREVLKDAALKRYVLDTNKEPPQAQRQATKSRGKGIER